MSLPLTFKECLDQGELLLTPPGDQKDTLKAIALHLRALVIQQSTENMKLLTDHAQTLLLDQQPAIRHAVTPMPTGVLVCISYDDQMGEAYHRLEPLRIAGWTVRIRVGSSAMVKCDDNHVSSDEHPLCTRCGVDLK